jgi:peptide/nickel transport system permease protein
MLSFFLRRFMYMVVLLVALSMFVWVIIQLPPGDYSTAYIAQMKLQGEDLSEEDILAFKKQYGLDVPMHRQYIRWVAGLSRGYLGRSFYWNKPINALLAERLPLTMLISIVTLLVTYVIAVPIGIYSATHQYSFFVLSPVKSYRLRFDKSLEKSYRPR